MTAAALHDWLRFGHIVAAMVWLGGDHAEARRQLARWAWGYALVVALLIAIAWDMVLKPGL